MVTRTSRRLAILAVLTVVPLFVEANVLLVHQHARHDFDQDCVTCRWTADTVAEIPAPAVLPEVPRPAGVLTGAAPFRGTQAAVRAAASRGPPLS